MSKEIDILEELGNFVFVSKYARYRKDLKRRETWEECVDRVKEMHLKKFSNLNKEHKKEIEKAFKLVKEKKIVPSMRSLQFGGKAIESHQTRIYNCSVRHIDSSRAFSEIFYLLLTGTGTGIGLSNTFLNELPNLITKDIMSGTVLNYVIQDDIEGWADSIEALLMCYMKNTPFTGRKIIFDYSKIRKEGTPLKTGGGKAPGYKGLKLAHDKIKEKLDSLIEEQNVKRLRAIHAYDILMHCADAVLSGGVRRSACSVLFDLDDEEMMNAKTFFEVTSYKRFVLDEDDNLYHGIVYVNSKKHEVAISEYEYNELRNKKKISWFYIEPQRARSNNSVILKRDEVNLDQFKKIIEKSKQFGEPGFMYVTDNKQLMNPCFEISFIPVLENGQCGVQMCNLSSINGAKIKTKKDFITACKYATLIGTLQATYTDFHYLNNASKILTEQEALLGVSITGVFDSPKILLNEDYLQEGAHKCVITNKKWARILGINQAARITCIKPEGTSSLVLHSASGIHPHHSKKYIRRVQVNHLENPYKHLKQSNPHACEKSVWSATGKDELISFPIEVKTNSFFKKDLSAIKHLNIIKKMQENWVNSGTTNVNKKPLNHSVSCTVIVKENEWDKVTDYLYKNRDYFSAVSLLADTGDKDYKQAPLEAVKTKEDEDKFNLLKDNWKTVDYTTLKELEDLTELQQTIACSGGKCDII